MFQVWGFVGGIGSGGLFLLPNKESPQMLHADLDFPKTLSSALGSNPSVNHQPRHTSIKTVLVLCRQEENVCAFVCFSLFILLLPSIIHD